MAKTIPSDVTFKYSTDQSGDLANTGRQRIEFYHIPSGQIVVFKAFLTAFDDAFSSEWESTTSHGRMDPIQTFKRTGRKINFAFDVVAGSLKEAHENQQRVSLLLQMLYPSYEGAGLGASTMKASPYFKVSIMNLAQNQTGEHSAFFKGAESGLLGTLDGFTYTPNLDLGCFFNNKNEFFPKAQNLSTGLTVIHQHSLGWGADGKPIGSAFSQFPYNHNDPGISAGNNTQQTPKTEAQTKKNDQLADRNSSQIIDGCNPATTSCPQRHQIIQNQTSRVTATEKAAQSHAPLQSTISSQSGG